MTTTSNLKTLSLLSDEELSALWAQTYLTCPEDMDPAVWFGRQLQTRAAELAQAHDVKTVRDYQFSADIGVWLNSPKKDLVQQALCGAVLALQQTGSSGN